MKPPRKLHKKFSRAAAFLCACLLAAILLWRLPTYLEAQSIRKAPAKKGAAESTNKAPDSAEAKPSPAPAAPNPVPSDAAKEKPKTGTEEAKAEAKPVETAVVKKGEGDPVAAEKGNSDAKDKDKEDKAKPEKKLLPTDEVQLSFQGTQVDMVVQWLAEQTGKSVVKSPKVQCQLTIVGSKKIMRRDAINLVYRALALEGFAVVESSKAILIVPEGQEPKMSPEMLATDKSSIPEGRQKFVKIFPLNHIQAVEMKEKIKGLLSEKGTIDTDDRANQIIVNDYTENVGVIGEMLLALDSDKPQDVAVRVIPLKNVSAQDLVKEMSPLYQKLTSKSTTKETVEITANERSNSLIILSSESNFKALQDVIAVLDVEEAQEKVLRAFPLKNAEAADVAKQVQDLYQEQDTSSRYPFYYFGGSRDSRGSSKKLNVVADRRRNTLIVQAPPSSMDNISKMIEALDEPVGDETLAPKIYALKYVSAPDIEDILNELFLKKMPSRTYWDPWSGMPEPSNVDRDVGRLYGKVRITSEPYSNALIITANSAENLAAVEAILKQLDVPSTAGETTLRVGLNFAKAPTVANSINILFAKGGSPAPGARGQQPQQPNPTPQQQSQQSSSSQSSFGLEQETKEEGYFPWLGGQQENQRTSDGRNVNRQVSDLVGKVRVVPDQRSNSLLISANVHFFPQILKLIEDLDAPTAQVLIEAKILEVSSDFLDKLGVRWSPKGDQVFTGDDFDNSMILNGKGALVKGFGGGAGGPAAAAIANGLRLGALQGTFNLDFLVQFLKKTTDATVLAEPQINIEDNQTGRIFVGQQVPILDNTLINQVGGQTSGFKYKDVGVILEVTPHINTSGDVSLKIHAESSAVVPGQTVFNGSVFDTRNFKTDLEAKDGQTLVLGGIIQRQVSDTLRKTPILGDIPGLGWAFKKRDKTTREVELMVFLRPKVVRTPEQAKELLEEIEKKAPLIREWEKDYHKSREEKLKDKRQSSRSKAEDVAKP